MAASTGRTRWSVEQFGVPRQDAGRRNTPPQTARPRDTRPAPRPYPQRGAPNRPPARPTPAPPPPRSVGATIDAFDLFCAYHLAITP
ncbi:MAG: hypothetical protein ABIR79_14625, partial [Candidatus Binatia bacterium]